MNKNTIRFLSIAIILFQCMPNMLYSMHGASLLPMVTLLPRLAIAANRGYQVAQSENTYYKQDFARLGVKYTDSVDASKLEPHTFKNKLHSRYFHSPFDSEFDSEMAKEENEKLILRYGGRIRAGYEIPLYIEPINKQVGFGVFTQHNLQAGDFIGDYTGVVVAQNDLEQGKGEDYAWVYPSRLGNLVTDAYRQGNFMRFVNHSNYPNVTIKQIFIDNIWHTIYVANQPIKKGQQLFVNYGPGYWYNRPHAARELNRSNDLVCKLSLSRFAYNFMRENDSFAMFKELDAQAYMHRILFLAINEKRYYS